MVELYVLKAPRRELLILFVRESSDRGTVLRTVHVTTDWFQIGKGVHQDLYCHPAYLTYVQSTS